MTTVAGYLLTRLTEAGVISVFGVPGDDNLGIPAWDWAKLPAAVARDVPAAARRAVTVGDLDAALLAAGGDQGLPVLIEAVLGWTDAPPLLRDLARVLATSDSYSG